MWQTWTAIYAAFVATAALALEVRRWFETGVRLRMRLKCQTPSSSVLQCWQPAELVVTVSNRGDRATTITHLTVLDFSGAWLFVLVAKVAHRPTKTLLIPTPGWAQTIHPPFLRARAGKQWHGVADWNALAPLVISPRSAVRSRRVI
jgi:hypothetical protein